MLEHGSKNTTVSQSISMQKSWPISSHPDLMLVNNPNMYIPVFHECPSDVIKVA